MMINKLCNYLNLAKEYVRLNMLAQLEYKGAFAAQIIGMVINDGTWLSFWCLFFSRFPALRGWDVKDVITMWAVAAAGFGLAYGICGNALRLPGLIAKGQLDAWMLYPPALLPHLLFGKMVATCWGDALFGIGIYIIFVRPDIAHLALFLVLVLSTAILFVGFGILCGSLGFYLGNSQGLSQQWHDATITFSTYPATLFDGSIKLILFTLIPAGFISFCPVEALRQFSWQFTLASFAGAVIFLILGTVIFYHGLSRYESGNLMEMRG